METNETKKLTVDERIELMFNKVAAQKSELAIAETPRFITGGKFRYSEGYSGELDITTIKDKRKLVEIAAFLKERSKNYIDAAEELGADVTFTWFGFTVEDWMKDLKTRMSTLNITDLRKKLSENEAALLKIVSPDKLREMEADRIAESLGL